MTPILKSLHSVHWLTVDERIEYKLLSLTYKLLTTTQPTLSLQPVLYLQPPHSARYSFVVTLSRRPTVSSLKITKSQIAHLEIA